MPVNFRNLFELEILLSCRKIKEQLSGRPANLLAMFQVAYITVSMIYCGNAWLAFYDISN